MKRSTEVFGDLGFRIVPWPLVVLAGAVMLLAAVGLLPRWPGLLHLLALPPLDLYAALRMLLVYAPNYPAFIGGLLASLAIRSAILALLLGGLDLTRLGLAARFYGVALAPGLLASSFLYGASAVIFYLLFWTGSLVALAAFCALGALPWQGSASLRQAVAVSIEPYA